MTEAEKLLLQALAITVIALLQKEGHRMLRLGETAGAEVLSQSEIAKDLEELVEKAGR